MSHIAQQLFPCLQHGRRDYFILRIGNIHLRWLPILLILGMEWLVFKYFYPQAGFINGDSYAYMISAQQNLSVYTYPIGYSRFLRIISAFSKSDLLLTTTQFFTLLLSMAFLLATIFHFYRAGKWTIGLTSALLLLNPVCPFLANYVSSDCLFLSLSLLWFSLLIWIIDRPSWSLLMFHALLLFIAFTIRYNALFYPLIALLAFILAPRRRMMNIMGVSLAFLLIAGFIWQSSSAYQKIVGIRQFSPFTGWQLANNVLHAYRYIPAEKRHTLPLKFSSLDHDIRHYFDTTRNTSVHPQENFLASTFYMWHEKSPLRIHMQKRFDKDSSRSHQEQWAILGPFYNAYGWQLIKAYPKEYLSYYFWPNFKKYYAPPVEFLGQYSTGRDTVPKMAKNWFGYDSQKLRYRTSTMEVPILKYYYLLAGMSNALFPLLLFAFFFLKGRTEQPQMFRICLMFAALWLVNMIFSTFASPVALRFQLFPFLMCGVFDLLILDFISQVAKRIRTEQRMQALPLDHPALYQIKS